VGEYSWARLTIGGPASRRALAAALETLVGCQLDECLQDNQVVVEDPEAAWGGFAELEAWLETHGLPFDLETAARAGGWPDLLIHVRPGRGRVEFACDDAHHEPVIPRSVIRGALGRCRTVRGVRRWLARRYPTIPPLPPIAWVPDPVDVS
jgi:hypothetical protein